MLEIKEIKQRLTQGMTQPYLCRATNGSLYIVKGRSTLGRGKVAEYICAHLARAFGLPLPEFSIANVPSALADLDTEMQQGLGSGPAFASKKIESAREASQSNFYLNKKLLKLARDLYLFDFWIKNEDRTGGENGGNPNILAVNSKQPDLYIIDHNLAFDQDFNPDSFRDTHISRDLWHSQQPDMLSRLEYQARIEQALKILPIAYKNLPPEWFECSTADSQLLEQIKDTLMMYNESEFWEILR